MSILISLLAIGFFPFPVNFLFVFCVFNEEFFFIDFLESYLFNKYFNPLQVIDICL